MYSVVDIGKSQYVKSKFKVFHKISVLVGYFLYISEAIGYTKNVFSQKYSAAGTGNTQYVKSKFKVFQKI